VTTSNASDRAGYIAWLEAHFNKILVGFCCTERNPTSITRQLIEATAPGSTRENYIIMNARNQKQQNL